MAKKDLPRLIVFANAKRCSVCMMPFPLDAKPSQEAAFANHVLEAHKAGQTSDDSHESSLHVVRETIENE